jgi:hypothetical protein
MPLYIVVHGVVLTTWYGLVLAPTCLVAARRTDLHRRLGIITVGVALLVVPVSALVVIRAVPRLVAAGMERSFIRALVVGDLSSLVFFSIFVGTAIYFRRRPDIHKRLMIVACFVIFEGLPSSGHQTSAPSQLVRILLRNALQPLAAPEGYKRHLPRREPFVCSATTLLLPPP